MTHKITLQFGFAIALAVTTLAALAETPPRIYSPAPVDREFMQAQRASIDDLARINLGRQLRGEVDHDLGILQALLDRRVVRAEQTLELQAMGVVLGQLLAAQLELQWVVYEDTYGRSRALQLGDGKNYLFPITMISRRAEVGARVDVAEIYQNAVNVAAPYGKPLPFQ